MSPELRCRFYRMHAFISAFSCFQNKENPTTGKRAHGERSRGENKACAELARLMKSYQQYFSPRSVLISGLEEPLARPQSASRSPSRPTPKVALIGASSSGQHWKRTSCRQLNNGSRSRTDLAQLAAACARWRAFRHAQTLYRIASPVPLWPLQCNPTIVWRDS